MAYLTPNSIPATTRCGVLIYPDSDEFAANVRGALEQLTFEWNFVQWGALTPEQTAEAYLPMFDGFCLGQGVCRVIGEIIAFAGGVSPDPKWLVCDGSSVLRADYPDLFNVIGTTYGAVDSTHFNIPDMAGRSPAGVGTGAGLPTVTLGQYFGEAEHTLDIAEMPNHDHTDTGHTHADGNATPTAILIGAGAPAPSAVPSIGVTGLGNANISSTGGGGAHNNIGPRIGINYLIVALS